MASDNSGFIKIGVVGVVGWYAYTKGWLSFLGIGPAAAATPVVPVTPTPTASSQPAQTAAAPPPAASAGPAAPSLTSLYTQLVNAAGSANVHDPDNYNALLVGIYPAAGPLPDPNQLFAGTGWARPAQMPIASYWSLTSAWLQQNKGLAGMNGYSGLGALARKRGWA